MYEKNELKNRNTTKVDKTKENRRTNLTNKDKTKIIIKHGPSLFSLIGCHN